MDFLVNDLSMHGQFPDLATFGNAVEKIMTIRQEIERLGSVIYCNRKLAQSQVTADSIMPQAIQALAHAKKLAWIQWLTRQGPYWEDAQLHGPGEYLEHKETGFVVTETSIGEAAICRSRGLLRDLVSFDPSGWLFTPVDVIIRETVPETTICIPNHWSLNSVQTSLAAAPPTIDSWTQLATYTKRACTRLFFAEDTFQPLHGHPFAPGAAERIKVLLHTLQILKGCFDADKKLTAEGHRLMANHFAGEKAWFSDSSDAEKNDFENDLTFRHPEVRTATLFCPWHGKVKTPQIRIHFSWPILADKPLYVVYVGPKLTKR